MQAPILCKKLLASIADRVKYGEDGTVQYRILASAEDEVKLGEIIATIINLVGACAEGVKLGDEAKEGVDVVGMVTVSFSSKMAVITFTAQTPKMTFDIV